MCTPLNDCADYVVARNSVASAASSGEAMPPSAVAAATLGEHWPKSATLRAMPLSMSGQQQFHNMVHMQG